MSCGIPRGCRRCSSIYIRTHIYIIHSYTYALLYYVRTTIIYYYYIYQVYRQRTPCPAPPHSSPGPDTRYYTMPTHLQLVRVLHGIIKILPPRRHTIVTIIHTAMKPVHRGKYRPYTYISPIYYIIIITIIII